MWTGRKLDPSEGSDWGGIYEQARVSQAERRGENKEPRIDDAVGDDPAVTLGGDGLQAAALREVSRVELQGQADFVRK